MINNLEHSELIFNHSHDAIVITDKNNNIITVNNAFEEYTKYKKEEVIGKNPKFLNSGKHDATFYKQMWASLNKNNLWEGEVWNKNKNGKLYPEWLTITVNRDKNGDVSNYIAIFSDLTKIKNLEKKADYYANYDQFTGLRNKVQFKKILDTSIKHATRTKDKLAIIFLDIDKLKYINDTYGDVTGDKVILKTATRLKKIIRAEDSVARIDGDEFGILINHIKFDKELIIALDRIIKTVNKPIKIEGLNKTIHITCSIGISIFPDDSTDSQNLINYSNTALYQSKKQGNSFVSYKLEYTQFHKKQLELYNDLKNAIFNDEFEVYYQPQVDIKQNKVIALEALVRWRTKNNEFIDTQEFIEVSEEFFLISSLTEVIFTKAFKDFKDIKDNGFEGNLCLNLSPLQLNDRTIVDDIEKLLFINCINPIYIEIEVTENAIINSTQTAKTILNEFKQMGISIAIDDFGTGATSLLYLQDLPIDKIKIDKKLIDNLTTNKKDQMVVKTIMQLGCNMEYQIVIEGVESAQQLKILQEFQCTIIQGYIYSEALDIKEILSYLNSSIKINTIDKQNVLISCDTVNEDISTDIKNYKKQLEKQKQTMILAQKKYESSYDEFRTIFDLAPIGYCIIDTNLLIEKENQYFKTIINHTGHSYINLYLNNKSNQDFKQWIENLEDNKVSFKTFILLNETTYINIYARLFKKGDKKKYFISINDVTKDIKKNKELHNLNTKLNELVNQEVQKNIEQERLYFEEQLKSSQFKAIGKMAAGLTHEINTPLAIIKANLELLGYDIEDYSQEDKQEEMFEYVDILNNNIKRIGLITNSLNELSSTNREIKEDKNLYEVLLSAISVIYPEAKYISNIWIDYKLYPIDIEPPYPLYKSNIQSKRVEQVFISILSNALDELLHKDKFEDRKVDITIIEENDFNIINFIDNGNGINKTILKKLFSPLTSAKDSSGVGLGLHISKKIIEEHNGTIDIKSSSNGVDVEIRLPVVK